MRQNYLLTSLPIGVNEKEYRWRALRNGDFLQLNVDDDVSGRIKLSDRKDLASRMRRTYLRHLGMYKIGYSTERIVREDVIERSWSTPSRLFRVAIVPFVWVHSLFARTLCYAPAADKTLDEVMNEHVYELDELKRRYDISGELAVDDIVSET